MENACSLSFRNTNCPAMSPWSVSLFFPCIYDFAKDRDALKRPKGLGCSGGPGHCYSSLCFLSAGTMVPKVTAVFLGEGPLLKEQTWFCRSCPWHFPPYCISPCLGKQGMDNLFWRLEATAEAHMCIWAHPCRVIKMEEERTTNEKG